MKMKMQYLRFTELSSFSVKGKVDSNDVRLLHIGIESIVKDHHEMLIVNLIHAVIDAAALLKLIETKKEVPTLTDKKVFWITKEKAIGDFGTIDLLFSRFQGAKFHNIAERLNLEDQIYEIEHQTKAAEDQIIALGFDEHSSQKAIMQNQIIKSQKNTLEKCVKWQKKRKEVAKAVLSDVEELDLKIKAALSETQRHAGRPVDL